MYRNKLRLMCQQRSCYMRGWVADFCNDALAAWYNTKPQMKTLCLHALHAQLMTNLLCEVVEEEPKFTVANCFVSSLNMMEGIAFERASTVGTGLHPPQVLMAA